MNLHGVNADGGNQRYNDFLRDKDGENCLGRQSMLFITGTTRSMLGFISLRVHLVRLTGGDVVEF